MFSGSTILTVYIAPRDTYSYNNFRKWHEKTKRRWRSADVLGADEIKILENNRRHNEKYDRKLNIKGWFQETKIFANGRQYAKAESTYQDVVGDVYYDYFSKFATHILSWWGVGGRFKCYFDSKKSRNAKSIPNTPMLDVSVHFDSNSLMEKLYMKGMTYDDAAFSTLKGRTQYMEFINEFTKIYSLEFNAEEAYKKSLYLTEIIQRNNALKNNFPSNNEYNFLLNYYNKFINPTIREMAKIKINFYFLKELMTNNPNLGLYVLGPNNNLYRIQGLVGKRDQNVIIQMENFSNVRKKNKYEFVYSVSRDTLVYDADKGFIKASKLTRDKSKIVNMQYGRKKITVEHRYRSEMFYDLILEGKKTNNGYSWYDAYHNMWCTPDYSKIKNLENIEIIC